jgi:hypothetical protein
MAVCACRRYASLELEPYIYMLYCAYNTTRTCNENFILNVRYQFNPNSNLSHTNTHTSSSPMSCLACSAASMKHWKRSYLTIARYHCRVDYCMCGWGFCSNTLGTGAQWYWLKVKWLSRWDIRHTCHLTMYTLLTPAGIWKSKDIVHGQNCIQSFCIRPCRHPLSGT